MYYRLKNPIKLTESVELFPVTPGSLPADGWHCYNLPVKSWNKLIPSLQDSCIIYNTGNTASQYQLTDACAIGYFLKRIYREIFQSLLYNLFKYQLHISSFILQLFGGFKELAALHICFLKTMPTLPRLSICFLLLSLTSAHEFTGQEASTSWWHQSRLTPKEATLEGLHTGETLLSCRLSTSTNTLQCLLPPTGQSSAQHAASQTALEVFVLLIILQNYLLFFFFPPLTFLDKWLFHSASTDVHYCARQNPIKNQLLPIWATTKWEPQ